MTVLVTGAAGLLGAALTAALAAQGKTVIAMVHKTSEIRNNTGDVIPAAACDPSSAPSGIQVVRGDVRNPGLGLDPATREWLDRHVSAVVHCAALVRFEAAWDELEAINVTGTRHVAQLCPCARFIHVSTAYVCGLTDGLIAEAPCDPEGPFGNDYERSKAEAETSLREQRPEAVIARPSIIVGEAASGRIRSFDTIYRAFKFIAEGKITAVPSKTTATLNFVPIDHVVDALAALVDQPASDGRIVHLAARRAVPAQRFLDLVGTVPGLCSPRIVAPEPFADARTSIAERLARPYWGYFQRHPDFLTGALAELTGLAAPAIDDAVLLRQIAFCVSAGFIRPRT